MIFILLFVLFVGFIILKNLKPKYILKLPKKYILANINLKKQVFFTCPLNFLHEETKRLFAEKQISFLSALKFDETLSKVRFHIPQKKMFVPREEMQKLKTLPIYFLQNFLFNELQIIALVKQYEDFLIVINENEKEKIKGFEKDVFVLNKNDKVTFDLVKDLNINYEIGNYKINNYQNVLKILNQENITKMVDLAYMLTKIESKVICAYLYDFFIGEKVSVLIVENKTNQSQNCEFSYFLDLVQNKINYLFFKRSKNFVIIQNVFSLRAKYFNYTKSPRKIDYSKCRGLENSNLPCLKLSYFETLLPKQKKEYVFMYSKNIIPLKFYSLSMLHKASQEYLSDVFNLDIFTPNSNFNTFFNEHIKQKALIELLKTGKTKIKLYNESVEEIVSKYKSGFIDALSCFLSLKNKLVEEKENSFVFNPHFCSQDFSFNISYKNIIKQINVTKKNLQTPCLIVDGVKYYNHLELGKNNLLTDWAISIEY